MQPSERTYMVTKCNVLHWLTDNGSSRGRRTKTAIIIPDKNERSLRQLLTIIKLV